MSVGLKDGLSDKTANQSGTTRKTLVFESKIIWEQRREFCFTRKLFHIPIKSKIKKKNTPVQVRINGTKRLVSEKQRTSSRNEQRSALYKTQDAFQQL